MQLLANPYVLVEAESVTRCTFERPSGSVIRMSGAWSKRGESAGLVAANGVSRTSTESARHTDGNAIGYRNPTIDQSLFC